MHAAGLNDCRQFSCRYKVNRSPLSLTPHFGSPFRISKPAFDGKEGYMARSTTRIQKCGLRSHTRPAKLTISSAGMVRRSMPSVSLGAFSRAICFSHATKSSRISGWGEFRNVGRQTNARCDRLSRATGWSNALRFARTRPGH